MLSIPDVTRVDIAFGNISHMPRYGEVPEEFKNRGNAFVDAVSTWFFSGASRDGDALVIGKNRFEPKDGVNADKALAAIRAVLGSFEPKHEHKEAACAFMLSEWFDLSPSKAA